eukprot:1160199-Pelagomonas_calceolata.AAC.3
MNRVQMLCTVGNMNRRTRSLGQRLAACLVKEDDLRMTISWLTCRFCWLCRSSTRERKQPLMENAHHLSTTPM